MNDSSIDRNCGQSERQTLVISGRLPGLNDILRLRGRGPFAWNSTKERIESEICLEIMEQEIQSIDKALFVIRFYEPNMRRDPDNIDAGKKLIFDALVRAGVIQNDGWENVRGITLEYHIDKKSPRVEVDLVPLP